MGGKSEGRGADVHSVRRVDILADRYYAFPGMKTLTIKVPDELFAEISRAAEIRKVPKSEVVRERLLAKSRTAGGGSLWDRMEDLVIGSDSLPMDLSSNKGHLKDYGKKRSD